MTHLSLIPDELVEVILCVSCVRKRSSRGINMEEPNEVTLPKLFVRIY